MCAKLLKFSKVTGESKILYEILKELEKKRKILG